MKKIYLFLAALSLTASVMANPVSKKAAANIAKSFFAKQLPEGGLSSNGKSDDAPVVMAYESDELYVFNGQSGFVVVSADDQTSPVLGWSDSKQFDSQNINPAAKVWLESYEEQIQALKDNPSLKTVALSNYAPVKPLVPFKWNQSEPYNKLLHIDKKTGERCIAGCPSVSLAQVIATVKYPEGVMPRGIPAQDFYEGKGEERKLIQHLDALPATSFNWDKMKEKYDADDESDAPDEVAKLIKYAGYASGMVYTSKFSAAWDASTFEAARLFFGYSEVNKIERSAVTYSTFENTIYDELKANCPVVLSGSAISSENRKSVGHSFVVDGYDQGYYHINWGWGGQYDGYFVLSVLNYEDPGEKGMKVANGYNFEVRAVYGFKKPTIADPTDGVNLLGIWNVDLRDKTVERVSEIVLNRADKTEDFPAVTHGVLFDREISPYINKVYDIGWNIYDANTNTYFFTEPQVVKLESAFYPGERRREEYEIVIPKDIPDGTYQLHWLFRDCKGEKNTDKWFLCYQSSIYCMEFSVEGNKLTVWPSFDDFDREGDTKINSVTVVGEAKVYNTVTLKFNATNHSNTHNKSIYLWASDDDGKFEMYNGTGMNIDKGKSGDFYLTFFPETAGTWNIALLSYDSGQYNAEYNILSKAQSLITVKGTSLYYDVSNIDKDAETSDSKPLLSNSLLGKYEISTSDKAPCTKTMYIILKKYSQKDDEFLYSENPNDPMNKKVVGDFQEDKPLSGNFSFTDLEKNVEYKLAVGELVAGKVVSIYDYPTTYIYKSDDPSIVNEVNTRIAKPTPVKYLKDGKIIIDDKYNPAGQPITW